MIVRIDIFICFIDYMPIQIYKNQKMEKKRNLKSVSPFHLQGQFTGIQNGRLVPPIQRSGHILCCKKCPTYFTIFSILGQLY